MLLTLLALLIVILLAMYMATQGALTAVLVFISGLFSALMAIGTFQVAAAPLLGWKPEVAHAVAFLGIFFVTFSVLRVSIDLIVPKNVELPTWVDRVFGGVVGLIAATVIVGTILTGIDMLPLGGKILGAGYVPDEGKPRGRVIFANMATGFYYMASGRGFGGQRLSETYPDLGSALVGYRHTVQAGTMQSMHPSLIDALGAYTPAPERIRALGIPSADGKPVVVRTSIKQSIASNQAIRSADTDSLFRITPAQVRLVVRKGNGSFEQYHPIGHIWKGKEFVPLPLSTGALANEYGAAEGTAIYDWVFAIDDNATPELIEVRRGGLAEVAMSAKAYEPLAESAYPVDPKSGSVTVEAPTLEDKSNIVVWVLKSSVTNRASGNVMGDVFTALENIEKGYEEGTGGWGATTAKWGVPDASTVRSMRNSLLNDRNAGPDHQIPVDRLLKAWVLSKHTPDPRQNARIIPELLQNDFLKLMESAGAMIGSPRQLNLEKPQTLDLAKDSYQLVAMQHIKGVKPAFRMWVMPVEIKGADQPVTVQLKGEGDLQPSLVMP